MRRRTVWTTVCGLLAVVMLAGAWCAWSAYRVNKQLTAAVEDVDALRTAVERGDDAAADTALDGLRQHAGSAAELTDSLTWSLLRRVPSFGDDATGIAVVSDVVADLSDDGLAPLVRASGELDSLAPRDGRLDPATVVRLQQPVAAANAAFATAHGRLAGQDPSGYVERLRSKYRELAGEVRAAAAALEAADRAVSVLPAMLGAEGARDYLMVFQNNAEIRATGGLPGAVSLLHADRGTLTMTRQVAANEFGRTDQPVLPLTDGEREVYDDKVGTWFLNANLQPDFPRAAELWKARWEQVHPERIDGVVSLDPIALSYVLGATGPIEVDGVQLSEETAVDELLHRVYLRLEDPADQDEFFRAVASAMFDRMTAGAGEPRALLRALATGAKEGRVTVHSFEDAVQQHLAGTAIAGEAVKSVGDRPQVGVYLSDATGAKMSYFLRYETTVEATYCANGMQGLSGRLRLTSTAPADAGSLPDYVTGGGYAGVEPGTQRVFVRLFGPLDGEIDKLVLDGEPITDSPVVDYDGRGVVTAVVELAPGQTSDLTWTMRTGVDQVGPIDVSVTPSVQPGSSSFRSGSACS